MKRSRVIAAVASVLIVALAATLAVLWPGYDAREVPPDNASVWVLQTGDGKRYARVNSDLGELDVVRQVENPSGIAQHQDSVIILAEGNQRYAEIHEATPVDLNESQSETFEQTPTETTAVVTAGEWIAYLTARGGVSVGRLGESVRTIDLGEPGDDDEDPKHTPTAIGVSATGEVAMFSATTNTVITMAAGAQTTANWVVPVSSPQDVQLSNVGGTWVLLDVAQGEVWAEGNAEPIASDIGEGAVLQASSDEAGEVIIADGAGLVRVGLDGSGFARLTEASGTAAQPVTVGGETYAAWVSETQGFMWSTSGGSTALDFAGLQLSDEQQLSFMTNGSRVVLNEQHTGWVWSVPDGELLPSSLQWALDERVPEVTDSSETERVLEPKPPVAEPDAFGVRAGRSVVLPVLLNDHDPNEDVLSIVADSVRGLDPSFGVLTLTNNAQQLIVDVADDATGSATFTYAVTDGTSSAGLNSQPTTVTLSVTPEETNTAPEWCGVTGCLAEWPTLEVSPGDTQAVNVLDGWVDPDGDPLFVSGVENDVDFGQLITEPDGTVTYRHPDPSDDESRTLTVDIVVSDAQGNRSTRPLTISATPEPTLTLTAFAETGATDSPVTIDFREAVRGATGPARLTALTLLDDSQSQPTITRSGLTATFTSGTPGRYLLQATVTDGVAEATAVIRVTVIDRAEARISTVPLTAFVRPGEDATVDVLPAVSDPAGDVLLLDGLDVQAEGNAELSVDVVGQRYLRVMGATEDGAPGMLGTVSYRVSDGSGSTSREARGEVTLILLPALQASPPIAVDDRVVVRAGEQIDVPVLDNDTAPAGSHVQLDPSEVVNEHNAGLAFGSGRVVRYLAPDEPGEYTVRYQTSLLGSPSLTSTARIHITVNGDEGDTAPSAPTLEGRVRAGQSVSIPFEAFGTDADGDVPRLDRVLTQPDVGSASISPEGDTLIYTSREGQSGQTHFSYRVRDGSGMTGVGTVRVGVIDNLANPSPITYSDYVQVQAGPENLVTVQPLDNDLDPSGSELQLTGVVPNATPGTSEHALLASRLRTVDTVEGQILIEGGTDLGTYSYEYTAENANGDNAKGLIVVKVVREQVPSYPRVQDTVLTAETLQQLPDGVDVVTGQVAWNGGTIDDLELELWDPRGGYSTSGWNIRGSVAPEGRVVPFSVSGTTYTDEEVTSYGFLRVPGTDDLALSLRSAYQVVTVTEDESVDVNLAEAVRVPHGETLEVLASDVRASGSRTDATCAVTEGLTVRYTAGVGAPWQDVCTIPVKLSVQDEYTQLALQIQVVAMDPQPILRPATITVSPGDSQEYDLMNMVDWQGTDERPAITFDEAFTGDQFALTREGTRVTVRALDTAQPSREETVEVTLHGPYESSTAPLILTVGRSPQTLPKGATVTAECSQFGGASSCVVPVIGGPGEVNPFPETPLALTQVSHPAQCDGVTMSVENPTSVRVNWRDDLAGAADCRASFTVTDAQKRTSTGNRTGELIFDLQGLPANPTRLEWVSYTADSVTLRPVSEPASIPQVTTYRVTGNGVSQDCAAGEQCTIRGLTNGEPVDFTATAINAVGESRGTASVAAWAYRTPDRVKNVSWEPVPNGPEGGKVSLTMDVQDRSTESVTILAGEDELQRVTTQERGLRTVSLQLPTGNEPTSLTLTSNTKFEVPPVPGGGRATNSVALRDVHGVGAPRIAVAETVHVRDRNIVLKVTDVEHEGAHIVEYGYQIGPAGSPGECRPRSGHHSSDHVFERLDFNVDYTLTVCARHVYEGAAHFGVTTWQKKNVRLEIPAPQAATYTVGPGAIEEEPGVWTWPGLSTTAQPHEGYVLEYVLGGRTSDTLETLLPEAGRTLDGPITIRNCLANGTACSTEAQLRPTGVAVSPRVEFENTRDRDGFCVADNITDRVEVEGLSAGTYEVRMIEQGEGGAQVRYLRVRFPGLGLDEVTSQTCSVQQPEPDPEPEEPGDPEDPGDPEEPGDPDPGAPGDPEEPGDPEISPPDDSVPGDAEGVAGFDIFEMILTERNG